jgi:tetratricopeptide (TPR) repeat protein
MKDEHVPVKEHEHAEPTVIHHPEEDMTVLARWLQHGMEQGARFWLLLGGVVLALAVLAFLSSGVLAGKATGNEAWLELTQAKTVEERLKVADAHPDTPAAGWARLYSAREEYDNGVDDLTTPGRKELAGPRLKKALDLFRQVAKEAGKDTSQAVGGLFGAARTLEARNELPEAIEQYKLVIERFPNTPEAKQSQVLIKALEEPINQLFYKELYAYKPPTPTPSTPLPGMGTSGLEGFGGPGSLLTPPNLGLGQPSTPSTPSNMTPPPAGLDAPPPSTAPVPASEPPKTEAPKKAEAPAPTEAPKPEPPK